MLKIDKVSKSFEIDDKKLQVLKEVEFKVEDGDFLTIIGPSGCGKSTMLRIIADLIKPTSGKLEWEADLRISFVFQNFALFPYLTVFENIEFGLKMSGMKKADRTKKVNELIEEVGLSGFADKHPKELSGGMKQRVGLARALVVEPNLLLLDEPFSSLDEFTAESLRKLLLELWLKRKVTVVMVTHLISEALELSDKIVVMSTSPGTVREVLENNLPRLRNLRSEEFFNKEDYLKKLLGV